MQRLLSPIQSNCNKVLYMYWQLLMSSLYLFLANMLTSRLPGFSTHDLFDDKVSVWCFADGCFSLGMQSKAKRFCWNFTHHNERTLERKEWEKENRRGSHRIQSAVLYFHIKHLKIVFKWSWNIYRHDSVNFPLAKWKSDGGFSDLQRT